jgi:hypothetical protein
LICAEGIRWREHRRFSLSVLKNMGMVKIGGNREAMGERIFQSAHDLIQVYNFQLSALMEVVLSKIFICRG